MKLNICSYNCCSLRKNIDIIRELTSKNLDIIFLQETFVVSDNISILQYVDENYDCIGAGAIYSDKSMVSATGRPMGGMGVMRKRNSNFDIKIVLIENDLIVVDVIVKDRKITLINTYIRSDLGDPESHSNYLESLFNLENILEDHDSQNILLVGDFNADPLHGRAWHNLNDFMTRNSMRCYDYQSLPVDSFSYVSFSDSHIRWLDHLIGKLDADLVIDNVEILYDLIGSDHLPLKLSIDLPVNVCNNPLNIQPIESRDYVDWNALSGDELQFISEQSFYLQGDFGNHTINSCNYNCENKECLEYLDRMYESIVESVHISSLKFSKNHVIKINLKSFLGGIGE